MKKSCILFGKCVKPRCDFSCPEYAETDYLLSRNNISLANKVFRANRRQIRHYSDLMDCYPDKLTTVFVRNTADTSTIDTAQLLTYIAVCKKWKGNTLHCSVYHLHFSSYLDDMQRSWGTPSEAFEYQKIWIKSAKILIISSIDYVQFKDFPSQALLNIIQGRKIDGLCTIVVSPPTNELLGDRNSMFFSKLKDMLNSSEEGRGQR